MTEKTSYTWAYSTEDCITPGPFIKVNIYNDLKDDLKSSAIFIMDSGAEATLIKKEIFEILELTIAGDSYLEVAGGKEITCLTCYLLKYRDS